MLPFIPYTHPTLTPPHRPHIQVKDYVGNEALEATLYSMVRPSEDEYYTPGFQVRFEARARFLRHPLAPPGHVEACVRALKTNGAPQMGPAWPCRTRGALEGLLTTSLWMTHLEYVLVFRRGNAAVTRGRWAHDRREAAINFELYEEEGAQGQAAFQNRTQDDARLGLLHLADRLALDAFPPRDGYICFGLDDGDRRDGVAWRRAIIAQCLDLVQLYVGEVEPPERK